MSIQSYGDQNADVLAAGNEHGPDVSVPVVNPAADLDAFAAIHTRPGCSGFQHKSPALPPLCCRDAQRAAERAQGTLLLLVVGDDGAGAVHCAFHAGARNPRANCAGRCAALARRLTGICACDKWSSFLLQSAVCDDFECCSGLAKIFRQCVGL